MGPLIQYDHEERERGTNQGMSKIANKPPEAWGVIEHMLPHSSQKEPTLTISWSRTLIL